MVSSVLSWVLQDASSSLAMLSSERSDSVFWVSWDCGSEVALRFEFLTVSPIDTKVLGRNFSRRAAYKTRLARVVDTTA